MPVKFPLSAARRGVWCLSGDHKTVCYQVGDPIYNIDTSEQTFEFHARSLFSSAPDDKGVGCDLLTGQSLWIVALANETPTSGAPPDGLDPALEIKFMVDVTPLNAPDDVTGGSGETEVRMGWVAPSGADVLTTYEVYYDMGSLSENDAGDCSSDLLVSGEALPSAELELLEVENVGHRTSIIVDPGRLGLTVGEQVPAALVALDAAGNRSVASDLVCVRMVETNGFWDACDADTECRDGMTTCSISYAADRPRAAWVVGIMGGALWLRRATRKRSPGRLGRASPRAV